MFLIDTDKPRSPKSLAGVYCVIGHLYRSLETADDAARNVFTVAGTRLELGSVIDFRVDPYPADEEWRIEWFKFYFALDLAHAFAETGERRFVTAFERLAGSFIDALAPGAASMDSADVAARRVQNWIYARQRFAGSPYFTGFSDGFEARLTDAIVAHLDFIESNLTAERNHRTLELYALFIGALALPALDKDGRRLRFATEQLAANLLTDIRPDGVQRENSSDYHLIVLRSFLGVKKNAAVRGLALPEAFDGRLEKACEFAMHLHRPDGGVPSLSDGDAVAFPELLILAGELFGRADFIYVATGGARGTAPTATSADFPDAGYFFQRSGWAERGDRFLVFDCGPLGDGGHGHYDILSVEIAGGGRPLVADPGRYTYSEHGPRNWRHYFKGTAAHNTVVVDGLDQTEYRRGKPARNAAPRGEFLGRVATPGLDAIAGRLAHVRADVVHTRRIFFVRGEYWLIHDRLESASEHEYELRFHLLPEDWNRVRLAAGRSNALVRTPSLALAFAAADAPFVEPAWHSFEYGVKHRAPCVCVRRRAASTDFFTLVAPMASAKPAPSFAAKRGADGTWRVTVTSDATESIVYSFDAVSGRFVETRLETGREATR